MQPQLWMFPDSSIFPHFCIPHDVWCFKSFVLNARILKPILGNRVAGMDQHKSLGISRSCDVRDVLGEVDGAAKVVGSDANSHWLVCFTLWILGGNEKKPSCFCEKIEVPKLWVKWIFRKFPYFSRCFGFFCLFFQEFGCGPGGCHPFIFECMMPLRRKGMKGREWGSNTSKPPPRQRFALNSPVSLPGEHWGPHLQAIFDISFQLLDGFRPFKICTQWCTGWDVWLGVVPYGRWDLCDVSAFGDWYLDAVDVGFCPRRFPDVTAMELASLPFGIESDMQKQWKKHTSDAEVLSSMPLWCRTNRETYWTCCEMGRKTVSILSILCCPYVYFFPSDLNWCVRTLLCVAFGFAQFGLLLPQWIQQWQPWKVCPRYTYCVGRRMLWSSMHSWTWQVV